MLYPIAIEPSNNDSAWGVSFPDLPGCFSAGDTLDEAMVMAKEAASLWIEYEMDQGRSIPEPGKIETYRKKREYKGWVWGIIEIDPASLDTAVERVNITVPARVLRRIDRWATEHGKARSTFLVEAAMRAMT